MSYRVAGAAASLIAIVSSFTTALPARAGVRGRRPAGGIAVHVVQTSASLAQGMSRLPTVHMKRGSQVRSGLVVRVTDGDRYQTIVGFGATLTDSSAWLIHNELFPAARRMLVRRLFSRAGLDLNYIRLPMAASDYTVARRPYTYDDLPVGKLDPSLRHFSIAHDVPYIIPTLREALALDPRIFIIASPWTAPAWMKTNGRLDNFRDSGTPLPDQFGALATYFVRFLRAYERAGVRIDAVTPQNEPNVAEDPGLEFTEPSEATFITDYLHPALAADGFSTSIYGVDLSWDMGSYAESLAAGSGGLTGISWHCYFGNPGVMSLLHSLAPQLTQLVDECSPEIRAFSTAQVLIGSLRNWASGFAVWNLALDPAGGPVQPPGHRCPRCRGVVTVDEVSHTVRTGPTYYQLGQVSRFVERGAVRVGSNTFVSDGIQPGHSFVTTAGLDDVAFVNPDGEKVLIANNSSDHTLRFTVSWRGHRFLYREPAGAMTTFTWR